MTEGDRKRRYDSRRGSSSARGYDKDWRACRLAYLAAHPLCECDDCKAGELRITPAGVVDHILSIEERPDLRLVWSNLRAMAKACHDRRTARDQGFNKGKSQRVRGCNADGTPLDHSHAWNR